MQGCMTPAKGSGDDAGSRRRVNRSNATGSMAPKRTAGSNAGGDWKLQVPVQQCCNSPEQWGRDASLMNIEQLGLQMCGTPANVGVGGTAVTTGGAGCAGGKAPTKGGGDCTGGGRLVDGGNATGGTAPKRGGGGGPRLEAAGASASTATANDSDVVPNWG